MQEQDSKARGIVQNDLQEGELPRQKINTIAQLYSQLQATIDKDKGQQNDQSTLASNASPVKAPPIKEKEIRKAMNDSASLPSSSRSSSESGFYTSSSSTNSSSPITPHQNAAQLLMNNTCTCHHWLVSIDSEHCGVCDEPLPLLKEWQMERSLKSQTIERAKSQLERLLEKHREQRDQILELQQLEKHKQAVIECRVNDMASMRQDLQILHTKYKDETSQIEEIQRSKESVKRELEELSQRLFEEANEMVNIEKQEKQQLQTTYDALKEQLTETQEALDAVSLELQVLRTNMSLLDQGCPGSPSVIGDGSTIDLHEPLSPQPEASSTSLLNVNPDAYVLRANVDLTTMHRALEVQIEASEDDQSLMEFRQFMDTVGTVPLRKLHTLPFIKHCLDEDIRPTLRFGPNPRISSRKIIDAILVKTCFVEECPPGFASDQLNESLAAANSGKTSLWERLTVPAAFYGCQACGRQVNKEDIDIVLKYRFRTSYFEEWVCIDRYCRDRLEATIQFYSFIRQLRIGTYRHRSLTDVYQECSRLRLQMLLCRMGMLPSALQVLGLNTEAIGKATTGLVEEESSGRRSMSHLTGDEESERLSTSAESVVTV